VNPYHLIGHYHGYQQGPLVIWKVSQSRI